MPFQLANIQLALSGDRGNTVTKINVTPPEVAILQAIHGNDAVFDIEPTTKVFTHGNRQERARLDHPLLYGGRWGKDRDDRQVIDLLFPGVGARLFERFDELDLDESFFKTKTRVGVRPKTEVVDESAGPLQPPGHELTNPEIADMEEAGFGDMPEKPASLFG